MLIVKDKVQTNGFISIVNYSYFRKNTIAYKIRSYLFENIFDDDRLLGNDREVCISISSKLKLHSWFSLGWKSSLKSYFEDSTLFFGDFLQNNL